MASTQKLELILSYLAATVYMNLEELPLNLLSRLAKVLMTNPVYQEKRVLGGIKGDCFFLIVIKRILIPILISLDS